MRFKIKFQQEVQGTESCECIIEALDQDEALNKLYNREFTSYLVTKQDAQRTLIEDFKPEVSIVNQ